jgi:UDP-N-acetylmuramoylalanine--D-glutamate ligase
MSLEQIKQQVVSFKGVPFRQEKIDTINGITFINDSTSTTPEAVMVALDAYPAGHFILGGTTKHLNLSKLARKLDTFQGKLFLLRGSGTDELLRVLTTRPPVFNTLQDAFSAAVKDRPPEVVFSPGFTSFELFKNEFERADQFNALVKQFS